MVVVAYIKSLDPGLKPLMAPPSPRFSFWLETVARIIGVSENRKHLKKVLFTVSPYKVLSSQILVNG